MDDLLSRTPAEQAEYAIAHLKAELQKFDESMAPHYERLTSYARDASDDGERERCEHFSREASKYRAQWQHARQPYSQQIQQIAMARDAITPRTLTYTWAQGVLGDIPEVPAA